MHVNHRYLLAQCRRLSDSSQPVVLDFGCGDGSLVEAGRRENLEILGADVFYDGASVRQKVIDKQLLGKEVLEIHNGVLPFAPATFDAVVANQVFEHVEDLEGVLGEIHRVLKPGGVLISIFPVRECIREGHCGIPFVHRLPRDSRLRFLYMLALRSCGLGHHKKDLSPREWSENFLRWLDRFTCYRSRESIRQLVCAAFGDVEFAEDHYMRFRIRESALAFLTPAVRSRWASPLLRWFGFRLGSTVAIARKANASQMATDPLLTAA